MKEIMKKRNFRVMLLFGLLLTLTMALGFTSQAASNKVKALKAYKKMLAKTTIDRDGWPIKAKNCKFAIAYIDNNNVPELVLYNDIDVPHAGGYGTLYTYRNGAVKFVRELNIDSKVTGYYKKKGIFTEDYYQGGGTYSYVKLNKGTATGVLSIYEPYSYNSKPKSQYYKLGSGSSKKISKKKFNTLLKNYVGTKRMTTFKFYNNTAKNRKKYLL